MSACSREQHVDPVDRQMSRIFSGERTAGNLLPNEHGTPTAPRKFYESWLFGLPLFIWGVLLRSRAACAFCSRPVSPFRGVARRTQLQVDRMSRLSSIKCCGSEQDSGIGKLCHALGKTSSLMKSLLCGLLLPMLLNCCSLCSFPLIDGLETGDLVVKWGSWTNCLTRSMIHGAMSDPRAMFLQAPWHPFSEGVPKPVFKGDPTV